MTLPTVEDGTIISLEMAYDQYCQLENDVWNLFSTAESPNHKYYEQGNYRSVFELEDTSAIVLDFSPERRHMVFFNAPNRHNYVWTLITVWCLPKEE